MRILWYIMKTSNHIKFNPTIKGDGSLNTGGKN